MLNTSHLTHKVGSTYVKVCNYIEKYCSCITSSLTVLWNVKYKKLYRYNRVKLCEHISNCIKNNTQQRNNIVLKSVVCEDKIFCDKVIEVLNQEPQECITGRNGLVDDTAETRKVIINVWDREPGIDEIVNDLMTSILDNVSSSCDITPNNYVTNPSTDNKCFLYSRLSQWKLLET